eukprot:1070183-Rhodomonas_salina.2
MTSHLRHTRHTHRARPGLSAGSLSAAAARPRTTRPRQSPTLSLTPSAAKARQTRTHIRKRIEKWDSEPGLGFMLTPGGSIDFSIDTSPWPPNSQSESRGSDSIRGRLASNLTWYGQPGQPEGKQVGGASAGSLQGAMQV